MNTLAGLLISLLIFLTAVPSWADATVANLTSGVNSVDGTSSTTASIAPTANRCVIIQIANRLGAPQVGGPTAPTVSGNGLTWTRYISRNIASTDGGSSTSRLTVFYAPTGASPSAGAVTITSSETFSHQAWSIEEISGGDISSNCSVSVVQIATGSSGTSGNGTTATATFTNPPGAGSVTVAYVRVGANVAITPGTSYTQLSQQTEATDGGRYLSEYLAGSQSATATWTGSNPYIIGASEFKAADAAPASTVSNQGACMVLGVRGC